MVKIHSLMSRVIIKKKKNSSSRKYFLLPHFRQLPLPHLESLSDWMYSSSLKCHAIYSLYILTTFNSYYLFETLYVLELLILHSFKWPDSISYVISLTSQCLTITQVKGSESSLVWSNFKKCFYKHSHKRFCLNIVLYFTLLSI